MTSKWLLRKAHEGILPKEILRRRKMGFGVPIERWLRRDLRQLSRDVLLSPRARERDLVRPEVVARLLDEHQSGAADHSSRLWTLLMLESWLRIVVDGEAIA